MCEEEAEHVRLVRQGNAVALGNVAFHSVTASRRTEAIRTTTPNMIIEAIDELLVTLRTALIVTTDMTLEEGYAM